MELLNACCIKLDCLLLFLYLHTCRATGVTRLLRLTVPEHVGLSDALVTDNIDFTSFWSDSWQDSTISSRLSTSVNLSEMFCNFESMEFWKVCRSSMILATSLVVWLGLVVSWSLIGRGDSSLLGKGKICPGCHWKSSWCLDLCGKGIHHIYKCKHVFVVNTFHIYT